MTAAKFLPMHWSCIPLLQCKPLDVRGPIIEAIVTHLKASGSRGFLDGGDSGQGREEIPNNAEAEIKRRGARYRKAFLPFVSNAVSDGRLVTG